ncbi:recombination protein RecR [bacterium]|nr:recombination protein RecR [bacterium]
MSCYPDAIETLISWFSRLPGVGYKSAERMVMHLLEMREEDIQDFAASMTEMKRTIRRCAVTNALTDREVSEFYTDPSRDSSLLCVVETSRDMFAVERSGVFKGRYLVLGGKLSPLNGIGPDELAFDKLIRMLDNGSYEEIIVATGSDVEGEATAVYIQKLLHHKKIRITRIAYGVPVGSSLDYTDEMTIMRALQGRREY